MDGGWGWKHYLERILVFLGELGITVSAGQGNLELF